MGLDGGGRKCRQLLLNNSKVMYETNKPKTLACYVQDGFGLCASVSDAVVKK